MPSINLVTEVLDAVRALLEDVRLYVTLAGACLPVALESIR
jgi:hypothetical protein